MLHNARGPQTETKVKATVLCMTMPPRHTRAATQCRQARKWAAEQRVVMSYLGLETGFGTPVERTKSCDETMQPP